MMRVLVTGGRGYIGGRLVRALAEDQELQAVVAGRARAGAAGAPEIVVDWHDPASIGAACRGCDAIVHLAALNEHDSARDPEEALRVNGLATLTLTRAAAAAGVRRFVYLSTIKVFGANAAGRLSEDSLPQPEGHYAVTHRLAEDYVRMASGKTQMQGVVLRLSNCLGAPADPAVDAWMLIANDLCRQAAVQQRIVLHSSGLAWRNFVGMRDVVQAIRHCLVMPAEPAADGLFNLGGPASTRIWDLARQIAGRAQALFGKPVALQRKEPAPDERHPELDWRIDKLTATGWRPRQSLDDEIDATL